MQTQIFNLADFTGGLNLRADPFQLGKNESPECLNVDFDPRGGVKMRRGIDLFADALSGDAHSIGAFETTSGTKQVVVGVGTGIHYTTGSTFSSASITRTVSTPNRMVSYKDNLYLQNGTDVAVRWNGTAKTDLGTSYVDSFTAPTGGNMPKGKFVATFQNHVFVANVAASGNRIHFSHPNMPEDFRSTDYFDVDTGQDGDVITALVPNGDRLLVFKQKSIHAIYGYDWTSWQVVPISHSVGTIRQESVVATDAGIYFFSWPNGIMRISGNKIETVFESLMPLIQDANIDANYRDKITVGWGGRRLWVSVPQGAATANTVYVLDPTLSKSGSWTKYDCKVGPFLEWKPSGSSTKFLAAGVGNSRIQLLEQDQPHDDIGAGDAHIVSHYRTPWIYMGQPAVKKRWKRPVMVLQSGDESILFVTAYKDFNQGNAIRNYTLTTSGVEGGYEWGVGPSYIWGGGTWTADSGTTNELIKGSSMGVAHAIALKVQGPGTNTGWGLDSISFKFQTKPVR